MGIKMFIKDFISLFYPIYCLACGKNLVKNEECICTHCLVSLPKINFYSNENPLMDKFIGRVYIEAAIASYYFKKGSTMQHLMHQLKYKGQKNIGEYLGLLMGIDIMEDDILKSIDLILPIPLHPNKIKKRGYNQSEIIAKGVQKATKKPLNTHSLVRHIETDTQTKRSHYNRWENIHNVFKVIDSKPLEGKHILLVDDVITTGSTLEAATHTLLAVPNTKVSIACLAFATF